MRTVYRRGMRAACRIEAANGAAWGGLAGVLLGAAAVLVYLWLAGPLMDVQAEAEAETYVRGLMEEVQP